MFEGTPLMSWYLPNLLNASKYPAAHMSDALRFTIIYKYGGIYLDLDTIVLRSLGRLHNCLSQAPTVRRELLTLCFYVNMLLNSALQLPYAPLMRFDRIFQNALFQERTDQFP